MAERKWIYVLRGGGENHAAFGARMRNDISPRLLELEPSRLDLTVTDAPPPKVTLFPFKREPIAIFNIHADLEDPSRFEAVLKDANIDAVVMILMLTDETGVPSLDFIVELARRYPEKPLYITFSGQKKHMDAAKAFLEPKGVPTFPLIEEPFEVLSILNRCRQAMLRTD